MDNSSSIFKKTNRSRKVEKRWSYCEDKDLIEMVEEREAIWNNCSELYAMRELKAQNWEEIANRVQHTVTDCKNRWNSVRSRFNKERTLQGERADFQSTYQFYGLLKFLSNITGRPRSKSLKEWTKKGVFDLIDLWREHECLYNHQHPMFYEKTAREERLQKIAEDMREKGFVVTVQDIKTKMCFLRGNVHKPEAYWSDKLAFLLEFINVPKEHRSHKPQSSDIQLNSMSSFADSEETLQRDGSESDDDPLEQYAIEQLQPPNKMIKKNRSNESINCINPSSLMVQDYTSSNHDNDSTNRNSSESDDAFFKYIGNEMQFVTDEELKDEMHHDIIEIILRFKKRQRLFNANDSQIILNSSMDDRD